MIFLHCLTGCHGRISYVDGRIRMRKVSVPYLLATLVFLIASCEEETNKPVFRTLEVSDLTSEGVTLNGTVITTGGNDVEDYGFIWSEASKTRFSHDWLTCVDFHSSIEVQRFGT